MVTPDEFRAWREGKGLSQEKAGEIFGKGRVTITRWEKGEQAIPAGLELPKEDESPQAAAVVKAPAKPKSAPKDERPWLKLSRKEREALPPGSLGWRYDGHSTLPKGRWIERKDAPESAPSGAVVLAIQWNSNGVGRPSMILLGDLSNAKPMHDLDGFPVLNPGVYRPAQDMEKERDTPNPKGGPAGGSRKAV